MTVLLVLSTFAIFLLIDHFYSRRTAEQPVAAKQELLPRLRPALVGGFQVPDNLRYHPGHTWALSESPTLVRVGIDDFAAKLMGKLERITLPQPGQWIRQGQKMCSVYRHATAVDLISPMEGTVSQINPAVAHDPDLVLRDPYGEGWLMTVHAPDAKTCFRNLLGGMLSRWWTEEAATRLQRRMPTVLDALAQDGGVVMNHITTNMPEEEWLPLAKEFFLT